MTFTCPSAQNTVRSAELERKVELLNHEKRLGERSARESNRGVVKYRRHGACFSFRSPVIAPAIPASAPQIFELCIAMSARIANRLGRNQLLSRDMLRMTLD